MTSRNLNIGPGGGWKRGGWLTVDYYHEADVVLDLRTSPQLPLPSHAFDKVFCSHVIEHLPDDAVRSLLCEIHRLLRYNGIVRLSCPDAARAVADYRATGDCDPQNEIVSKSARHAPGHLRLLNIFASFQAPSYRGRTNSANGYSGGPIVAKAKVDEKLSQSSLTEFARWCRRLIPTEASYTAHINAFWAQKLRRMLAEAGFVSIRRSEFQKSADPELRSEGFDGRPHMSLFMEARARTRSKWLRWKWDRLCARVRALRPPAVRHPSS